jgi:GntP family gluconate:H+ symporter
MNPTVLLLIALGGVALLLLLVLKFKFHPFVALLSVSIIVALAAGISPKDLVSTIELGMGSVLGHIAIIIALGAMVGRIIDLSGGAQSLATTLIEKFGNRRTPLALTAAGFLLGIPVFFEVGVIILMPLAYGVAKAAKKPLLIYALPMCAAMLTVHAFLPPHPGPVAVAGLFGADIGWILLWGLPLTAVVTLACYFLAKQMTDTVYPMSDDVRAEVYGLDVTDEDILDWTVNPESAHSGSPSGHHISSQGSEHTGLSAAEEFGSVDVLTARLPVRPAPSFTMIASLILLPIVLILLGTVAADALPEGNIVRSVLLVLGAPLVALLIDALLCGYLLGIRRGWSLTDVSDIMGSAIPPVATVILIAGAGGVFGKVLVATKIGDAVAGLLQSTGLPILALAFLFTLLLRAVQGSATVALVTTAGVIAPLVAAAGYNPNQLALVCLAMGAGALALSHINDAGYWIVVKLTGLSVGAGLRTWTALTTIGGLLGFGVTAVLWPLAG